MKEITLKIEGMECNGCENRIINAVKQIEGIIEVKADYKEGTTIIKSTKEVEKQVKTVIEEIGFTVVEEK